MKSKVWPHFLSTSELGEVKALDERIAVLDDQRLTLAAKRSAIVNRGTSRARLNASKLRAEAAE